MSHPGQFTPTRIPKASEVIVTAIRDRILRYRLADGEKLPSEVELMKQFGLGRVTVRESLRLLERDGIVDIKRGPGGGVTVATPGTERLSEDFATLLAFGDVPIRDLLQFRELVEPSLAALAARHASQVQREQLLAVAAEQRNAWLHPESQPAAFDKTVDFHELIAAGSGNGLMALMFRAVHQSISVHFRRESVTEQDAQDTVRAHEALAELVAAGDESAAEDAMRRHLRGYAEYLANAGLLDQPIIPRVEQNRR